MTQEPSSQRKFYSFTAGVCGTWGHRMNASSAHLVLGLVRCTPPIGLWNVQVRQKTHSRRLCTNTRPACGACAHQMCARCVWHLEALDERA